MQKLRTFIALPLPSELKEQMARVQSELRNADADVKWDSRDKFHITLKFLGDTDSSLLPELSEALRKSIGEFRSFDLAYEGVGGFPNVSRPKVIWIGTKPSEEVQRLQAVVEQTCTSLGFSQEERAFHAHITLGRVKGNRGLDRLTATLNSVTFGPSIARCTEIHIMRSDLKPSGSVYTLLNSIPLAP